MKHSYCSVGSVWANGIFLLHLDISTHRGQMLPPRPWLLHWSLWNRLFCFFFARKASMFLKVPDLPMRTPQEIVPGSHQYRRLSLTLTFVWISSLGKKHSYLKLFRSIFTESANRAVSTLPWKHTCTYNCKIW